MNLSEEQVLELRQAEHLSDWGPHEQRVIIHLGLGLDKSLEDQLQYFSAHTIQTFGKRGERSVFVEITPRADAGTAAAVLDFVAAFLERHSAEDFVREVLDSTDTPREGNGDDRKPGPGILTGFDSKPIRSQKLPEELAAVKEDYCRLAQECIENFQKQPRIVITATDTKDHECFGSADEDGIFVAAVPFDQYHWPLPPLVDLHFYPGSDPEYVALCCRKVAHLLRSDRGQDVLNMEFIVGGGNRQPWANVSQTGDVEIHAAPEPAFHCEDSGIDANRIATQSTGVMKTTFKDVSDPEFRRLEELTQQDLERIKADEIRDVPRGCKKDDWISMVESATSYEELRRNRQIKLDEFAEGLQHAPVKLRQAAKDVARLYDAKHRCDTADEAREAERRYQDAVRRQEILIAEQHICALALGLNAKAFTEPSLQLLVERVVEAYPMISRQLIEAVLAAGRGDVGGSSVAEFLLDAFDPSEDFNFVQWQLFCAELFHEAGHFPPPPNGQRNSGPL